MIHAEHEIVSTCRKSDNEMYLVISPDHKAMAGAKKPEIDRAMTDLFVGLAGAITKHGCDVDVDNPLAIRVSKR